MMQKDMARQFSETLYKCFNEHPARITKLITIKMICDGLGITLGEFFSTKEFDVLEQEIK